MCSKLHAVHKRSKFGGQVSSLKAAIARHDAANIMLYLTDGKCLAETLLGDDNQQGVDSTFVPSKLLKHLKYVVTGYDPDQHMFVLHDDFQTLIRRKPEYTRASLQCGHGDVQPFIERLPIDHTTGNFLVAAYAP